MPTLIYFFVFNDRLALLTCSLTSRHSMIPTPTRVPTLKTSESSEHIAVVIPAYKVKKHILPLIAAIGSEVHGIIVVDDCCPDESGSFVLEHCQDERVTVIRCLQNQGVGGAVLTGYKKAWELGYTIAVKLDGDGQMDPALLPSFIKPIALGLADYTKGNRFFAPQTLASMPRVRLFGNAALSFVSKVTSGYWDSMDPTNGYTAIHLSLLPLLPLDSIEKRYFFESDMLFRLNTIRAVVQDIPMRALYADEESHLRIGKVLLDFPQKYLARCLKRICYNYFVRDFTAASLELVVGLLLVGFGTIFGLVSWLQWASAHLPAPTGTIMLAVLPIILGFQLLLAALNFDIQNTPSMVIWPGLKGLVTPDAGHLYTTSFTSLQADDLSSLKATSPSGCPKKQKALYFSTNMEKLES
jgi:dolichol-phosphate mannosyltransferase